MLLVLPLCWAGGESGGWEGDVNEHVSTPVFSARGLSRPHPPVLPRQRRRSTTQLPRPQCRTPVAHKCLVTLHADNWLTHQEIHFNTDVSRSVSSLSTQ